ncbi:TKL protein kinase [Aphanomyces astaci]|uniref:TKL protein kinase n=1 Tax=Aphanomyces astaci TaxID=112090 RepID=W4GMV7_APHAT|nr:TKL protein kinase [Aphanomyces astaci]ETV81030.1 TKL protein kinase [Aphanomyces astaci]|eukprot:XP_009828888.1 TKL protein kinase [Aphanomyces astaci]
MSNDKLGQQLLNAACGGRLETVQQCIWQGANVNWKNHATWTPLHWASLEGHLNVVKLLVSHGADLHMTTNDGYTSLHWASYYGHLSVVQQLVVLGADIHATNNDGKTPLHFASQYGRLSVVQWLLDAGADKKRTTMDGRTARDLAESSGESAIVTTLDKRETVIQTAHANKSTKTKDGRTAPTEATGETSPSPTLQPTPPSSPPKAASNPQIPATSTEVATWGQGPPREVSVAEVQQWTDNFSPARKIGEGAFGDVFEGQCQSIPVAVKRLKPTLRLQGDEETDRAVLSTIRREIYVLSKFHHPHIIRLLGFTSVASVAQELCLVYELGSLGSMDQSLVDDARASDLTWKVRVRIAAAVARAINYLHCHDEKSPTFHRDIKSANIVLFHGFVPKLIDCGLSKFIPDPATTHHLGSIMSTKGMALGTPGYMCPTYIRKLQYDAKSEIYSFGIVLLELLTGRLMSSRRDGQDLYDEYIEDMTPIGPDLDARAGPWSVECAQRLEALARECLAPYKTRVSSMLTVLRRLVELEKTYCAATPEEIRMTQLVEDLQRQVDALRSSPKQPAEILRMCNICFDQSANGLGCGAGDVLHFICADCAPHEVQRILNEIEAEATQLARHRAQGGRIQCVMPGCDAVYSEQALAKVLPDAIFGHYRAAQDAVVEQRQYTYHQERFQLELEAARAEFKRSNDLARTRQDAAATAEFMRRQFPNAVQCPRCGAGPVIPENCYNLKTHHGESTSGGELFNASIGGNLKSVRKLIQQGANASWVNQQGRQTPLHAASGCGHFQVVQELVEGWTPLHFAALKGHLAIVKELAVQGANIHATTNDGQTSIYIASIEGHLEVVKEFVSRGVDIHTVDKLGWTPLHCASTKGDLKVVKELAINGADIHATARNGFTPLHVASRQGHLDVVQWLIHAGIDTKRICKDEHTASTVAGGTSKAAIVAALDKHVHVGWTELHSAAFRGYLEDVKTLVTNGADIHASGDDGNTPLHIASKEGHLNIVQWLLVEGADTTRTTKDGHTARDSAQRKSILIAYSEHEAKLTDRGIASFCAGVYESAVADANQAVASTERKDISAFAWLGEAFLRRDQYDFALAAFQEGLQVNPEDVDCMVGINDTNDCVDVTKAFGVPDMWAVLAKDPFTRDLLRAPKFKALIQTVRDKPSQYLQHKAELANVLAILETHRQSTRPLTPVPIFPPLSLSLKAASNHLVHGSAAEVAGEAIRIALVDRLTTNKGGRTSRVMAGAGD